MAAALAGSGEYLIHSAELANTFNVEFLDPAFSPDKYAHDIVESQTADVNSSLSKLNFGVENITRELKSVIGEHHSELLLQAASLGGLGEDLTEVRRGLAEVENGVAR